MVTVRDKKLTESGVICRPDPTSRLDRLEDCLSGTKALLEEDELA